MLTGPYKTRSTQRYPSDFGTSARLSLGQIQRASLRFGGSWRARTRLTGLRRISVSRTPRTSTSVTPLGHTDTEPPRCIFQDFYVWLTAKSIPKSDDENGSHFNGTLIPTNHGRRRKFD